MKLLSSLLLSFIACILFLLLSPVNLIYVLYKNKRKNIINVLSGYFTEQAIALDRFGNHNFRSLFNLLLKTKKGYPFGDFRETISSALGKNKKNGTLSLAGKLLDKILSFIDPDHCFKSIKELPDQKEVHTNRF